MSLHSGVGASHSTPSPQLFRGHSPFPRHKSSLPLEGPPNSQLIVPREQPPHGLPSFTIVSRPASRRCRFAAAIARSGQVFGSVLPIGHYLPCNVDPGGKVNLNLPHQEQQHPPRCRRNPPPRLRRLNPATTCRRYATLLSKSLAFFTTPRLWTLVGLATFASGTLPPLPLPNPLPFLDAWYVCAI